MGNHDMSEIIAYLGLGTNLGDRMTNLREALGLLASAPGLRLLRCSQVYAFDSSYMFASCVS